MTVITQPLREKKLSQQKEPLVNNNVDGNPDAESGSTVSSDESPLRGNRNPLIVTMLMRSRARRISSLTTICVFMTALMVFTTGIIGGYYLYRQFTQYRLRHFRGWCSIPYAEQQRYQMQADADDHSLPLLRPQISNADNKFFNMFQSLTKSQDESSEIKNELAPIDDFFDEEFDIDIEYERYERIEVPNFAHGRRGRFIHDFSVNTTGIIDLEEGRCFIMPLNRSLVIPPRSLFDLVKKMQTGYYNIDTEIVRDSYRVVVPKISNYKSVGYYIARECGLLPTYELEKVPTAVYKRSADGDPDKAFFSEFAGYKINEIHIVNMGSAHGSKK